MYHLDNITVICNPCFPVVIVPKLLIKLSFLFDGLGTSQLLLKTRWYWFLTRCLSSFQLLSVIFVFPKTIVKKKRECVCVCVCVCVCGQHWPTLWMQISFLTLSAHSFPWEVSITFTATASSVCLFTSNRTLETTKHRNQCECAEVKTTYKDSVQNEYTRQGTFIYIALSDPKSNRSA